MKINFTKLFTNFNNNIKLFILLSILLLTIYIILSKLNIIKVENNIKEGFVVPIMGKVFGNCIYNNMFHNIEHKISADKPFVDIILPKEMKITGFEVNTITTTEGFEDTLKNNERPIRRRNKTTSQATIDDVKYSILVGNNNASMKPIENEFGYTKFNFNELMNNISLFEGEDNLPKYIGKKIRIQLENYEKIEDKSRLNSLLNIKIYGLDVYAFTYNEYSSYTQEDFTLDKENKNVDFKENKKILAIKLNPDNITDNMKLLKIKYSNSYDGNERKMVVVGPRNEGFDISSSNIVYFSKPIIAEKIYFSDIIDLVETNQNTGTTNNNNNVVSVWYSEVSKRDEINFKIQMDLIKTESFNIEGESCPNSSEMLQKQLQAQQICEALEYKDRNKNASNLYEKEKAYLTKLAQQEKELKDLEGLISDLIKRKNERVGKNQYYNVEALDKELRKIEESRKRAEEELLKSRESKDIKLELKLDPQFSDIIKKYENLGIL